MPAARLVELAERTEVLTFDCYGTLIDWRAGLTQSFMTMFGASVEPRLVELFEAYQAIEGEVEADGYRTYREVLAEVARRMALRLALALPSERAGLLADTLPTWPAFDDTGEGLKRLKRRFRLGVLSNIDGDLFARTAERFPVGFDFVVTAQDVRSYKPGHGHFRAMLESHGTLETTVHVAQSLFHDGVPARELGLAYVWINRYSQRNDTPARPVAEFPDLRSLADALGC
jgi:2-haloacid dehalogenase